MNNFTIKYYVKLTGEAITYSGDGENFDLQDFILGVIAFKIIDGIDNWNNFVDENFSGLDDEIYYHYVSPTIEVEDKTYCDKWWGYDDGNLELLDDIITIEERYLKKLKELRKKMD